MHLLIIAGTLIFGLIAGLTPVEAAVPAFNSEADAETLRKALNVKVDEKVILDVVINRNLDQRLSIAAKYLSSYDRNLIEDVKKKTGENFGKLIVALLTPKYKYLAKEVNRAVSEGAESDLVEIMCFLSKYEIRDMNKAYQLLFSESLDESLKNKISDKYFRTLLISLNTGSREESVNYKVDEKAAKKDAEELQNKGDLSTFNSILVKTNLEQLNLIFAEYKKNTQQDIEKTIEKKFSGGTKKGFLAIVKRAKNKAEFYAEKFFKSMDGVGTHNTDLIRLAVTYPKADLEKIKNIYQQKYKRTLEKDIQDDTSGEYRRGLLTLVSKSAPQ